MKQRRRVDAELTDSGEPAYYVGPRPWYAKLATWIAARPPVFSAISVALVVAVALPFHRFGWWWVAVVGTGIVCFRLGFLAGRSHLFRDGP